MGSIDSNATLAINGLSGSLPLDMLMVAASGFGVPLLIIAVAGQWWVRLDRPHVRHVAIASGLSFLIGLGLNQIILLFVQRPRPYDTGLTHLLIERSADFSFPSDHATATVAIAAAFLLNGLTRRGLFFLTVALLVSFSRIYIGTHYASDVLGGAVTGLIAAIVVRAAYREGNSMDRRLTDVL